MWIKNKKSGIIWKIEDKEMIERLLNDKDYVESRKSTAEKKETKKES